MIKQCIEQLDNDITPLSPFRRLPPPSTTEMGAASQRASIEVADLRVEVTSGVASRSVVATCAINLEEETELTEEPAFGVRDPGEKT